MTQKQDSQRLRIVHIISGDRWAGAEVQAHTLITELINQGHTLHAILLNGGELANKLRDAGATVRIFDETRLSTWKIFSSLRRELKAIRPDVIHTHRQKENILGSIANKLTGGAKCVRTVHGAPEYTPKGFQKLQCMLDRFCGNYLQDNVIAVSDDLRNKLTTVFHKDKLCTIHNGLNPELVSKSLHTPDFKLQHPEIQHIGIVGRLEPVKRVDIFIRMAYILAQEMPNTLRHFHIFGDGSLKSKLVEQVATLDMSEHITFHGHRSDIRSCINSLDAVVMCSDHEGLPMTALECLALGTPVIAHRTGGLTALLQEHETLTTKSNIPESYAAIINQLDRQLSKDIPYPQDYNLIHTLNKTIYCYTN